MVVSKNKQNLTPTPGQGQGPPSWFRANLAPYQLTNRPNIPGGYQGTTTYSSLQKQGQPRQAYLPVGNGEWEAEYQEKQVQNPEWDYQNPPVSDTGIPLGMNNEPLPEGAQGWTPFGEPDFGPNLGGWWKGALYNIFNKPEHTVIKDLDWLENQKTAWSQLGQGNLEGALGTSLDFWKNAGANVSGLWAEKTIDPTTGERIVSAPGPLTYVSRGLQSVIQGLGQGLDVAAQTVESGVGTLAESLQDLGEGSFLPDVGETATSDLAENVGLAEGGEWRLPNPFTKGKTSWDLGWAQTLSNMTPPMLAYNAMRALTAPQKSWEEVKDTFSDNWQASRIAYSAFGDEALKQEFLARLKAGEDGRLLAMEMGQPWQELAGKAVADPLNLLGGGARKGANLLADAEKSFKAAPEIQAALDAIRNSGNLNDADGVKALQDLVTAATSSTAKRLTETAQNAQLFGRTATAKRSNLMRRTGLTFDNIIGASMRSNGTLDTNKAMEQLESLMRITSGKPDEITQGLGYVLGGTRAGAFDAGALLSPAGQETGLVLRRILDDGAGNLDTQKFLAGLQEAQKNGTVMDYVTSKLTPALDEMFPTVQERVQAISRLDEIKAGGALAQGEDVAKLQRIADLGDPGWMKPFFSGLYDKSRPAYNFMNGILGNVYMGMSPGYAVRNSIGNNFQTFVDLGPGAWGKGSLFNPNKMAEAGFAWGGKGDEFRNLRALGGISSPASAEGLVASKSIPQGKGLFGGLLEALTKGEPWKAGLRVGEVAEQNAAKRIVGYVLDRTMRQLTNKAVPVAELTRMAGLTAEQANTFRALLTRYSGDTEAAFKGLRAVDNLSLKNVLTNLSEADVKYLKDYDLYDNLVSALEDVGSRDELFNRLDDLAGELDEIGRNVSSEHVGAGDDLNLQAIQASKELPDNVKALASNQYSAAKQSFQAYQEAGSTLYGEAVGKAPDRAQAIADLYKEYAPYLTNAVEGALDTRMDRFRVNVIDNYIKTIIPRRTDFAKMWGEIGIPGTPPQGLTRQGLIEAAWDYYFNTTRTEYRSFRDVSALKNEEFIRKIQTLAPEVGEPAYLKVARDAFANAKQLDEAALVTRGGKQVMVGVQGQILDQFTKGNTANAIRLLANQYNIGSVTGKGVPYDGQILAIIRKYLGGEGAPAAVNNLSEASLQDAWRAFENQLLTKGQLPRIENLDTWLKTPEKVLNPPASPGPSFVRGIQEQVPNIRNYLDDLKTRIDATWGQGAGSQLTRDQEKALSAYLKTTVSPRMQEARRMAGAVAEAQRKFTILDYGDKTNFDLALAMVMPYHFWYNRTYKNWMTRMVQNPKLLADYARYRETLEQIHAGSPEWWKYNVNTNELLGLEMDNPMYMNLEAALNPLNGLTGVDFNDPKRRVDWWTRTLDDVSRFGPSIWSPITWATAYALHNKGENEAAARWGGRLFPQTATLKAIGALANVQLPGASEYNEYDPFVNFFSGGLDPWEQGRVGRAFWDLIEDGLITREQAIDAAHAQTGEVWDMAVEHALDKRGWGQIGSFLGGVGFKGRSASDIEIDQMYQEYYSLWNMAPNLDSEEFRLAMEQLKVQYPWMDSVLLAKKSGPERDRALAYNALGRIPPGQSGDITQLFGLTDAMVQQFYDNKGDLSYMTAPDRARFMASVVELSAALALPEDANRLEWAEVRNQYNAMQDAGKAQFGDEIWNRVSDFFALQKENPEAAKLMIANNPRVQAALEYREQAVMGNPLLFDYYGGLDFLQNYYEGEMYAAAKKQFGGDIFDLSGQYGQLSDAEDELLEQYYDLKETDPAQAKAFYSAWLDKDSNQKDLFLNEHPELKDYWQLKEDWLEEIARALVAFEPKLRDVAPELRSDYQPEGVYEVPAASALGYQFAPQPTWEMYQSLLSVPQTNLLTDYFNGAELSPAMRSALEKLADRLDLEVDELLQQMEQSYYQEQVPVTQ